ncbi:MAG: type I-G CRISPR-associated protein Csb2 [Tepidisphaeraceae bacterium]
MPTLQLRFPGGRYHATLWGHHVNEGLIEWPPSPWRLLRALVACGFTSQHWKDTPPLARTLIDKLASVLPRYRLPGITAAHTRHFMPYIEGRKQGTTLVWDTFANIGDGELLIHWPCELNSDETVLLGNLARHLNYLGRSESWVEAQLIPDALISIESFNAVPHRDGERRDQRYEQISLMAAIPADSYQSWQLEKAKEAVAHLELPSTKKKQTAKLKEKLDAERRKLVDPYPPDLIACLTKDTSWWKGHRWSQPPGSQRVLYWRPSQSIEVTAPQRSRRQSLRPVEMMLLALTTPSGNRSALPSVTRTLPQAELFHRAIIGRAGRGQSIQCPELTGKDAQGKPLREGHRHAHIFPLALDLDNDRHIDHILIFAPMGLSETARRAISTLRRTWTKGGVGEMQLAVVGKGSLDDLRQLPDRVGAKLEALIGPKVGARSWTSLTPFVPPRFLKKSGKSNDLVRQVNAELRSRGLPEASVGITPWHLPESHKLRHYVRVRKRGAPPPQDLGYLLRLSFAEPVPGPIALGYASHFGLGTFKAENDEPIAV